MLSEPEPLPVGRSEMEMAADTIAAIFAAKLLPMTRGTVSEVSIACRVPVRAIKEAWSRRDAGLWRAPSGSPVRRAAPIPDAGRQGHHQRTPRAIPDDATEWVCRAKGCPFAGKPQPVTNFEVRADSGTRRSICRACRKRYQRDRYLSVDVSERLGTILRFIVQQGDPCEGDACQRCHGPMLVGQEVETDDVLLVHHLACPQ